MLKILSDAPDLSSEVMSTLPNIHLTAPGEYETFERYIAAKYEQCVDGEVRRANGAKLLHFAKEHEVWKITRDYDDEPELIGEAMEIAALGRAIIEETKKQLEGTDLIQSLRRLQSQGRHEDMLIALYEHFLFKNWLDVHPEGKKGSLEDGWIYEAEEPAPSRIGQWPNGPKVNCLGISLALAAACELLEHDYVYVNRIRDTESYLSEWFQDFRKDLLRRARGLGLEDFLVEHNYLEAFRKRDFGDIALNAADSAHAFHHSIMVRIPIDENHNRWLQVDPYQLGYGPSPFQVLFEEEAFDPITELAHLRDIDPGGVLLVSSIGDIKEALGTWTVKLEALDALARNVMKKFEGPDAPRHPKQYLKLLRQTTEAVLSTYKSSDDSEQHETKKDNVDWYVREIMMDWLIHFAPIKTFDDLEKFGLKFQDKAKSKIKSDTVELALERVLTDYPELKPLMANHIILQPLCTLGDTAEMVIDNLWKSSVLTDGTVECGQADYMIGALYINHLSTWRKDGIINIARRLMQTSSSQILWHEAAAETSRIGDQRLIEVASTIGRLASHLVHPRVRLVQQAVTA